MEKPFSAMSQEEKDAHCRELSKAAGEVMEEWEGESKEERKESGLDVMDANKSWDAAQEKKAEDEAASGARRAGGGPLRGPSWRG